MPPRTRPALARFLDRVRSSYPGGVPQSVLRASQARGVACALLVITEQASLPERDRELLEAICNKGLKLPFERCCVTLVRPRSEVRAALSAVRESSGGAPGATIVFGSSEEMGTLSLDDESVVLHTHGLDRIGSDQGAKRDTWKHLQTLLPHLARGSD